MWKTEDQINDGLLTGRQHAVDFGLALIVATSAVTRVVVSRIAEQAGLRTHGETPETARPIIAGNAPAIALLAGGADGRDCDQLLEQLTAIRQNTGTSRAPRIVMLTNKAMQQPHHAMADATVMMPVTQDQLQPIIRDLMDCLRGENTHPTS